MEKHRPTKWCVFHCLAHVYQNICVIMQSSRNHSHYEFLCLHPCYVYLYICNFANTLSHSTGTESPSAEGNYSMESLPKAVSIKTWTSEFIMKHSSLIIPLMFNLFHLKYVYNLSCQCEKPKESWIVFLFYFLCEPIVLILGITIIILYICSSVGFSQS